MFYIKAKDETHLFRFENLIKRDNTDKSDCYRVSMFYLIAINDELYNHVEEFYDFETHMIEIYNRDKFHELKPQPWQTGTSRRIYSLALRLYNDCQDVNGDVDYIFNYGEYDLEYYLHAIRLRYDPTLRNE